MSSKKIFNVDTLREIDVETSRYKSISRVELFNFCINKKLAATLKKYNSEIDATSSFLIKQEGVRVLKAITKINKLKDKDVIEKYMIEEGDEYND